MQHEIDRCRREIAGIEAQLRAGHRDLQGLLLALADWHAELRLLQGIASAAPQLAHVRLGRAYGNLPWQWHLDAGRRDHRARLLRH